MSVQTLVRSVCFSLELSELGQILGRSYSASGDKPDFKTRSGCFFGPSCNFRGTVQEREEVV